jgi:hypothetical protein
LRCGAVNLDDMVVTLSQQEENTATINPQTIVLGRLQRLYEAIGPFVHIIVR